MARLTWDGVGTRRFETGIDKGVLYVKTPLGYYGAGVPWNGLTGFQLEEQYHGTQEVYYLDGLPYDESRGFSKTALKLSAYTFPEEFEACLGNVQLVRGIWMHGQSSETFGLCFQTLLGDDVKGTSRGFRLHLVYGCSVDPMSTSTDTLNSSSNASEFSFNIRTVPQIIGSGFMPSSYIKIDSTTTDPDVMEQLLDVLYGTTNENPRLPTIPELLELLNGLGFTLYGTNLEGGAWQLEGLSGTLSMVDASTFQASAPTVLTNADGDFSVSDY